MAGNAYKDDIPSFPTGLAGADTVNMADPEVDTRRDMEIAGAVDGDIAGRIITVLEGGSVHGTVGADTVVISGTVNGIVQAHNIEIMATARIEGELRYDNLSVTPGAHMLARCVPVEA